MSVPSNPYQSSTGNPKMLGEEPNYTAKQAGSNVVESRLNAGKDTDFRGKRTPVHKSGKKMGHMSGMNY